MKLERIQKLRTKFQIQHRNGEICSEDLRILLTALDLLQDKDLQNKPDASGNSTSGL